MSYTRVRSMRSNRYPLMGGGVGCSCLHGLGANLVEQPRSYPAAELLPLARNRDIFMGVPSDATIEITRLDPVANLFSYRYSTTGGSSGDSAGPLRVSYGDGEIREPRLPGLWPPSAASTAAGPATTGSKDIVLMSVGGVALLGAVIGGAVWLGRRHRRS